MANNAELGHPYFKYPKNMYHEKYHPVIVQTQAEEAIAKTAEYSETYVKQEYPKMVFGRTVKNAEEEKYVLDSKVDSRGNITGPATPNDDPKIAAGSTGNPPVLAGVDQTGASPATRPDPGNKPDGKPEGGEGKDAKKGGDVK